MVQLAELDLKQNQTKKERLHRRHLMNKMRTIQEQMSKELAVELLDELEKLDKSVKNEKRPRSASKKLQLPYHN